MNILKNIPLQIFVSCQYDIMLKNIIISKYKIYIILCESPVCLPQRMLSEEMQDAVEIYIFLSYPITMSPSKKAFTLIVITL